MAQKRSSETERAVSSAKAALPAHRKPATTTRTRKKLPVLHAEAPSDSAIAPPPVVEAVAVAAASEPAYEAVAALAYSYWEARGCQGGSPEEDWLRAEQELRALATA
jgi:hypothetical protein